MKWLKKIWNNHLLMIKICGFTTIILLSLWILSGCVTTNTPYTESSLYNNQGKYVGKSIDNGSETRFYDSRGKFLGKSIKQ